MTSCTTSIPMTVTFALVLLTGSTPLLASNQRKDIRYIKADTGEVFANPSSRAYRTNRLRKGTTVEVTSERADGWLEITPPVGSFSYIKADYLVQTHHDKPRYIVNCQESGQVPIFVGSEFPGERPTTVGVHVMRGTIFDAVGEPVRSEDGIWMRVNPHVLERRYIRADQVSRDHVGATVVSAHGSGPHGPIPPSGVPSANPAQLSPNEICARACQCERIGNMNEAIQLYAKLSADTVMTNPTLSNWAFQRAHTLRAGYLPYGPVASHQSGVTVPVTPVSRASGSVQVGSPVSSGGFASTPAPVMVPATQGVVQPVSPPRIANASRMEYSGILRRSGRSNEGAQTYVLDDPITLRPLVEFLPARGMSLDVYLGRNVTVDGFVWYRGDLRRNFMQAIQLRIPG